MSQPNPIQQLATRDRNGQVQLNLHAGQARAWNSERRFIGVIAGAQSGKTSFGPFWLQREIQMCGPGDYLVVTPTFPLLEKKLRPEFMRLFNGWGRLGEYKQTPVRNFTFHMEGQRRMFPCPPHWDSLDWTDYLRDNPTVIFFGYAEDPESLESATAKAAWLDEAGQTKFRLGSWEALGRRLAINQGRALITTTPYDLGWLKQQIWDRWQAGDPNYDVVNFDSTENPQFPKEEFERLRAEMPKWKFDLFYRGIFTRPAGMIYDCFNDYLKTDTAPDGHLCKRFLIPDSWKRFVGLDFGGVNTCALFFAEEPGTGILYLYRTYYPRQAKTAKDHARSIRWKEPDNLHCVGGSSSEDQWRSEFKQAGLTVNEPPIKDVEVGIQRAYKACVTGKLMVFEDQAGYRNEKVTYSRVVDEGGNPTEDIQDKKLFHHLDAERYIMSAKFRNTIVRKPGWKGRERAYV